MSSATTTLDVITIGRSSVDLYGAQIGGRLEDMASFSKAVGGCPTNIAIGTARLGLKSGLVTRVGDEHMGRFIREQLAREGVDVAGVHTDPDRLTALVILGVRDQKTFPLIFYRDNCADAALDESDIDEAYIASAAAIVVTGTHFARPGTAEAQKRAMRIARQHGRKVVFDVDYRPNLWGLAGHGAGEERYIKSGGVTALLRSHPARMRRDRRHRGRTDDRGRRRRAAGRYPGDPAGQRGADRLQARADGLRGVRPRDPGLHRGRHQGARLSGRRAERAGCGRRLHVGFPARLSARRAARNLLRFRQCVRRLRGLTLALLRRISDLHGAAALPEGGGQGAGPAPRCRAQPHPLGHDARCLDAGALPSGPHHGLRHRSPDAARSDGRSGRRTAVPASRR